MSLLPLFLYLDYGNDSHAPQRISNCFEINFNGCFLLLRYFILASTGDCELGPSWLLWLCVVFGVLFLVMLCVNVFLCSAMTCSFSRTEVDVVEEKAPSVYTVQDYDPYRSWAGSQYGSRFSLDHPGTRPLSAVDNGRPLGPDHPGTRVLGTPSMTYTSLQNTKSTYTNSRPGLNSICFQQLMIFKRETFCRVSKWKI